VLKYIFGGVGTGKTTEIFNQILLNKGNNNGVVYIVPEQFSLQSEKHILNLIDKNTTISIKVVSFKRLAYHVFLETGLNSAKVLDDTSKIMLIRKLLLELKPKLKFFKEIKITGGLISKISSTISEFHKYDIKPDDIATVLKDSESSGGLILKSEDISLIYNEYLAYIKKDYIPTDEVLDVLAQNIKKSNFLDNALVFIDEFSGFTHQEYRIIKELLTKAQDVTVALTIKSKDISYNDILETDVFYETKHTVKKLTKLASESYTKIHEPIYLEENKRHINNAQLKYLEKNIFKSNFIPYTEGTTTLKIQPLLNMYEEATYVAEEITTLVRDKNYTYSEIAILTPNTNLYERSIKSILSKYDIPFFIDANQDMLSHPLLEVIRATLDIVIQDWSYESIFRLLKTDMLDIDANEIDILENYVLSYGIHGYKWKLKEWEYGYANEEFDKEKIKKIRSTVTSVLEIFEKNITSKTQLTIKEISIRIFEMLYFMNIPEKIENLANEALQEKNIELRIRHSQIWGKVCEIFEKMVDILGEEKVNIAEFSAIFESGILNATIGVAPPTQEQIIVGDISRSKLPNIKILFVMGVNDGLFPRIRADDGIFNDKERQLMENSGVELLPRARKQFFEDNFLIYTFLLKPQELLILTYSMGNLEGKSMLPAHTVNHIKKLFKYEDFNNDMDLQISTPSVMRTKLSSILKDYYQKEEISEKALLTYKWFKENEPQNVDIIENIILTGNKVQNLNKNSVKRLYKNEITTSVSRIEKYVQCPFSFFVNYNLKAKERKVYTISSLDVGEVFHDILEKFADVMVENDLDIKLISKDEISKDEINTYIEECVNTSMDSLVKDIFFGSKKNRHTLNKITRILKKSIWALCEHIKSGKFSLHDSEIGFGHESPFEGISVEIDENKKFIFTGRIDRVDVMSSKGKKYVKVIDYKSGKKSLDITDIYYGIQLQLILYLDSIIKNGEEYFDMNDTDVQLMAGGIFYFKMDDPIVSIKGELANYELEEKILKGFKMSGLVLNDKEIIKSIDENMKKHSSIIPVHLKKDGTYGSLSNSLVDEQGFNDLMNYTRKKIKEIGESLTEGKIMPLPYKKKNENGCMYCKYKPICNFDSKDTENYMYNVFQTKKSISDLK